MADKLIEKLVKLHEDISWEDDDEETFDDNKIYFTNNELVMSDNNKVKNLWLKILDYSGITEESINLLYDNYLNRWFKNKKPEIESKSISTNYNIFDTIEFLAEINDKTNHYMCDVLIEVIGNRSYRISCSSFNSFGIGAAYFFSDDREPNFEINKYQQIEWNNLSNEEKLNKINYVIENLKDKWNRIKEFIKKMDGDIYGR